MHVSGSWSRDLLSSRLPCDPRCVWAHGAMAWCLLPLLSVCLTEGGWVGTGAAPGQPREEAEEGLCWPELLAKGIYLWLTTGTAELHNCSLPRVQGAASRQGQESFCDYFCSCRARFSPCSLKDFSHFSDSFPVRFFFLIGEFLACWNNAFADWAPLCLFLKSRGITFMPPPQLCQMQLLKLFLPRVRALPSSWPLH